jgi:hypothetical protein
VPGSPIERDVDFEPLTLQEVDSIFEWFKLQAEETWRRKAEDKSEIENHSRDDKLSINISYTVY